MIIQLFRIPYKNNNLANIKDTFFIQFQQHSQLCLYFVQIIDAIGGIKNVDDGNIVTTIKMCSMVLLGSQLYISLLYTFKLLNPLQGFNGCMHWT